MILSQLSVLLTLLLTINHCLTDISPDRSDIAPGTPDQTDTPPDAPDQSYIPPAKPDQSDTLPTTPELSDDSFDALESDHDFPEGAFDIRSLGPQLRSRIGAGDYKDVCLNGGTLNVSDIDYVFWCSCLPGFSGQRCQLNDCRNGGKPLAYERGEDGGLKCKCPITFGGDRCQAEIEECDNGGTLKWNDMSAYCDCPARFFGRRCLNECPASFTLVTTAEGIKAACYQALLTVANWSTSVKTCSSLSPNAHLAFARTKQENDRLVSFVNAGLFKSCPIAPAVFTGAQRRREGVCTDEFVWKNGDKPVEKVIFTDWLQSTPDCSGGEESCLMYYYGNTWNDVRCSWRMCGVCEVSGF